MQRISSRRLFSMRYPVPREKYFPLIIHVFNQLELSTVRTSLISCGGQLARSRDSISEISSGTGTSPDPDLRTKWLLTAADHAIPPNCRQIHKKRISLLDMRHRSFVVAEFLA